MKNKFELFFVFLIGFILLFTLSCEQYQSKKNLIGRWYEIDGKTRLIFVTDSMLITPHLLSGKIEWKATRNKIIYEYPIFKDSLGNRTRKDTVSYVLNKSKDRFRYNKVSDTTIFSTFIKANSYSNFLIKKNNINIRLPEDDEVRAINNSKFGFNIYFGIQNGKIIAKTEYSNDLNTLKKDINEFKNKFQWDYENFLMNSKYYLDLDSLKNDKSFFNKWIEKKVFFKLFLDKSLIDKKDSISSIISKDFDNKDIYQVYNAKWINETEQELIKLYSQDIDIIAGIKIK